MTDEYVIVTHNGKFHVDEVCAYAMLNYLNPTNQLIRTRDMETIQKGTIVIDVGLIYDHEKYRYDHHQSTFKETFEPQSDIKLSASGLIYKHYGQQLIQKYCEQKNIKCPQNVHKDFYYRFFSEIDAFDNGIRQYTDNFYDLLDQRQIIQKFHSNTNIGQIVDKLNTLNHGNHDAQMKAFIQASQLVWQLLCICLDSYLINENEFEKDILIFNQAMSQKNQLYNTGELVVITQECTNWQRCLKVYEDQHPLEKGLLKFIIYQNANNSWNIRAISDQLFKNRLNLLDGTLMKSSLSKPQHFIFVHNNKFIGSCSTLDSTIEMGTITLNNYHNFNNL